MLEKLTAYLDGFLEPGILGYDCIVYHKGKCIYGAAGAYLAIDRINDITVYYAQHVWCSPIDRSRIVEIIKEELK